MICHELYIKTLELTSTYEIHKRKAWVVQSPSWHFYDQQFKSNSYITAPTFHFQASLTIAGNRIKVATKQRIQCKAPYKLSFSQHVWSI